VSYTGCGLYRIRVDIQAGDFVVTKFKELKEKLIPFFGKYLLVGSKREDYLEGSAL
jgi:LAGLIDADG DNA endonuclease family protein